MSEEKTKNPDCDDKIESDNRNCSSILTLVSEKTGFFAKFTDKIKRKQELKKWKMCPDCGNKVEKKEQFCSACGYKFKKKRPVFISILVILLILGLGLVFGILSIFAIFADKLMPFATIVQNILEMILKIFSKVGL